MFIYLVMFPMILFAVQSEGDYLRKIRSHLLIEDSKAALSLSQDYVQVYPNSKEATSMLVETLARSGFEKEAIDQWNQLSARDPNSALERHLLEEMAWSVLRGGILSSQNGVRLASLIGSFLTNDVRALPILMQMMRDSNAVIRSVAVQMAAQYRDAPLKDEITRMMKEEKVWVVRLELIKACGTLRLKEIAPTLQAQLQTEGITYEERSRIIEALCAIYDQISFDEWLQLAQSNRAALRHLACSIAAYFEIKEAKDQILNLIHDSHPDVRIAALNAFGLFYRKITSPQEAHERLKSVLEDVSPQVAITAAWVCMITDLASDTYFERWLMDSNSENRRLAAAALSTTGDRGVKLSSQMLRKSEDFYVKANLAMGLLGQRSDISLACDTLYHFLEEEKRMWMLDTRLNPLFQVLSPSQIRHVDHIPNYPEAIDQMTRLNVLSMLALAEDPRALEAVKHFLKKKSWGITGVAAATLLQEGDETSMELVKKLVADEDAAVRLQACFVLAMLGKDETVLNDLQGAYVDADHEKKLHILEAMGHIGTVQSFHFLIHAFQEPFPILRIAAAAALIQSIHR